MDLETAQITTTAKLLTLKQENGNSFKPTAKTTTNADGTLTTLIPGPVTTEEKVQKKNNMKAKSMLLMALPNEHLMTFNQYKDAKTLFADIQTRSGGNEATKKTQKTLLKQMYKNFSTPSIESLDAIFNRLQKIIVEQEVKGTASSSSNSQNMAFVSSPSSTNEVNTAYGVSTANTQVSPASTQVSTTNLSDDIVSIAEHEDMKVFPKNWECRGPRNQDSRNWNQDSSRRTVNVEETSSKAMLAIDGAGFDWSYMADDEVPTNMALIAFSNSEFNKSEFNLANYKKGLASVEEQLVFTKRMSLDKLMGSQISDKSRKGLRFVSYNDVPPPPTRLFSPPNLDLSYSDLEEFQQPEFEGYGLKTSKNVSEDISNEVRETPDAPLVKELVSDDNLEKKTISHTVAKIEFVRPKQ
ncbi:hypothetical protein Tco_0455658 [Tanacetum coccineum]